MIPRDRITLGILAGGQGRRLGGVDKAFIEYCGEPLIFRTLKALGGGFAENLISYPHNDTRLQAAGLHCVSDLRAGFPGPLAGIEALLFATSSEWLLTLPVDLRDIPPRMCETLAEVASAYGASIQDVEGLQPLVSLWPVKSSRKAAAALLNRGEQAVHRLVAELDLRMHDISPQRLGNLNTPADFK